MPADVHFIRLTAKPILIHRRPGTTGTPRPFFGSTTNSVPVHFFRRTAYTTFILLPRLTTNPTNIYRRPGTTGTPRPFPSQTALITTEPNLSRRTTDPVRLMRLGRIDRFNRSCRIIALMTLVNRSRTLFVTLIRI